MAIVGAFYLGCAVARSGSNSRMGGRIPERARFVLMCLVHRRPAEQITLALFMVRNFIYLSSNQFRFLANLKLA